jgi:hypothetical protein
VLHYQRHNWSTGRREALPIIEGSPQHVVLQEILDLLFRPHFWRQDQDLFDRKLRQWRQVLEAPTPPVAPVAPKRSHKKKPVAA